MEYRVLGPLEVREGDRSLPLGGAKQRALLALLLLNANRVLSRERLIDELWGDDPPETAVATVQVYVSRLRKVLGTDVLVTRPPGYMLQVESGAVDVQEFERLRAAGQPEKALGLWRGPALAEFKEQFARTEGARLEDLRLATLEERIDADLELDRHSELIGELRALIAEHPHREHLREQLMLALYRSRRHAEALEAYRDTRAALDELGLEPSEQLRSLERAILTQDEALAKPRQLVPERPVLPGPLAMRPLSPFVGREREVKTLRSILKVAERGEGGQVALLGGEAGAGKTRLVRELAHEASAHGTLVLYGAGDATVNAPYQPFVEALEFLLRVCDADLLEPCLGSDRDELARLLPDLGEPPEASDPETARHRLHAAVAHFLVRVGQERPLLVVLDDVHWADAPSLHLLRDLARTAPEARLFLLVTHRDRSEDMRPEFSEALAALTRMEGITRVALEGLSSDDVAQFIRDSNGGYSADDVSEVADAVHELTDGIPFLLGEFWRELVAAGAVEASDGVLRLTRELGDLASPRGVRDVVQHRLSRLEPSTTELLEHAAVIGTTFELRVIEEALDGGLQAALHEALGSGTIEELPGPALSYRFSHELVRRALYDRLSALRRAELHLRVGEALECLVDAERFLPELAHHFAIAARLGSTDRAIEYNVRAAEAAGSLFAFEQAEEFATTALDFAEEGGASWARAQYLLADAEWHLAKGGAADRAEAAAAALARLGDIETAVDAEVLASWAFLMEVRGDEGDAASERALALVQKTRPSRAKAAALICRASRLTLRHGRFHEAAEFAREALAISEELGLASLQVDALHQLGMALGGLGESVVAVFERAIELSRDGVLPDQAQKAHGHLAHQMFADGRVRRAYELYGDALEISERFGLREGIQWHTGARAAMAYHVGDWKRAEELIGRYLDLTASLRRHRFEFSIAAVRAKMALARGDRSGALAHGEHCLDVGRRAGTWQAIGRGLSALALVYLEQRRHREAELLVDELMTLTDEDGQALSFMWLIDLAWLLHDLGRPDALPLSVSPAWNGPAESIASGEFVAAAGLLPMTDLVAEEMYARLRAAEQFVAEGRHADAQVHAENAAAFYRSVDATAYLQRAEAVLLTSTSGPR